MKFLVVSACDENYKSLQNITKTTLKSYAELNGYGLEIGTIPLRSERPPQWYKIQEILKGFDAGYDFVFWVDTDAIIVNSNIKLESFVEDEKDFYISSNWGGMNSGVMMFRNNQSSRDFLNLVWDQKQFINVDWWEQKAITHLIETNQYPNNKIKEMPASIFNSECYYSGCLVYHLAGISDRDRFKMLKKIIVEESTECKIQAKIIADSISGSGVGNPNRITTFELIYPRFVHAELMTHRMFSRNASSSRAIPVKTMIDLVKNEPAMPVHWGKNQAGMQAREELQGEEKEVAINLWKEASANAAKVATIMSEKGLHKQIANRILEAFQNIKVVVTATEFSNFFWLRCHPDAQPEIQKLADAMYESQNKSNPVYLNPGEWHVPYYKEGFWKPEDNQSLEDAIAISSSCCAQVSYRKLDDSIEKARDIYKRLVENKPVHASPFEHQATPMVRQINDCISESWEKGITHCDRKNAFWSGNFKGWIQNRQLIPGNVFLDNFVK